MKNFVMASLISLAALVGGASAVSAQEAKQDFELINKTGYDISHVYVSPMKTDDWEEDVLGKDVLSDGDEWEIRFQRATKTCKWDLKVVYADDSSSAYWRGIDLCKVGRITVRYDRKSDATSATFE